MELKKLKKNEVIFRQGDPADNMYAVRDGSVGIFLNYGASDEKKLTELVSGQYLGEMGLLENAARSATAVSLSDDTVLEIISDQDFHSFFDGNPELILDLLQQMSSRLRRVTRDYAEACRTVHDVVESEKAGVEKSDELKHRIKKTLAGYENAVAGKQNSEGDAQ